MPRRLIQLGSEWHLEVTHAHDVGGVAKWRRLAEVHLLHCIRIAEGAPQRGHRGPLGVEGAAKEAGELAGGIPSGPTDRPRRRHLEAGQEWGVHLEGGVRREIAAVGAARLRGQIGAGRADAVVVLLLVLGAGGDFPSSSHWEWATAQLLLLIPGHSD